MKTEGQNRGQMQRKDHKGIKRMMRKEGEQIRTKEKRERGARRSFVFRKIEMETRTAERCSPKTC